MKKSVSLVILMALIVVAAVTLLLGQNRASVEMTNSGPFRPGDSITFDVKLNAPMQAKVGVRRDLQKELSVPSCMGQLTRLGAAERQATEDKRPRMEGEFLFPVVALLAGELDGIELTKPAFRHRDGGKARANCG